jgi:hypothetical protein
VIAALQLHLGPLFYLVVPIVVAVVLIVLVALRHRRPKSLEANVESFNRGLQALSPGAQPKKRRGRRAPAPALSAPRDPARVVAPSSRGPRPGAMNTQTIAAVPTTATTPTTATIPTTAAVPTTVAGRPAAGSLTPEADPG